MALAVRTMSDAAAADDFDSDVDGVEGGSGPRSPHTRELRPTVLAGRTHSLEPAAAGDAVRRKVVDGTTPSGHRAVGSPEKEPSSAEQGESATKGFVQQQLLDLFHSLTSQINTRDELHRQELSQQSEKICALEHSVEQLQQDLQLERTQRSQQQLAQQAEVQGSADVISHETISTIERLDRNSRQANMFMAGVVLPAGGRGAMVRHVERLFTQHAPLTADAISHVTCLGPGFDSLLRSRAG